MEVSAIEIIRAVDIFMVKLDCPHCHQEQLVGLPVKGNCSDCGGSLDSIILSMDCPKRNIVAIDDKLRRPRQISKKTVRTLMSIQNGCCAYCSKDIRESEYHVDHITPLAAGGTSELNNLTLACPRCNLLAGSKYFFNISTKMDYIQKKLRS
jgi:hypothetical protein